MPHISQWMSSKEEITSFVLVEKRTQVSFAKWQESQELIVHETEIVYPKENLTNTRDEQAVDVITEPLTLMSLLPWNLDYVLWTIDPTINFTHTNRPSFGLILNETSKIQISYMTTKFSSRLRNGNKIAFKERTIKNFAEVMSSFTFIWPNFVTFILELLGRLMYIGYSNHWKFSRTPN